MVELFSLFSVYHVHTLYVFNPERKQVKKRRKATLLRCSAYFPGATQETALLLRVALHWQLLPWTTRKGGHWRNLNLKSCQGDFQGKPLTDWKEGHCSGDESKLHGLHGSGKFWSWTNSSFLIGSNNKTHLADQSFPYNYLVLDYLSLV